MRYLFVLLFLSSSAFAGNRTAMFNSATGVVTVPSNFISANTLVQTSVLNGFFADPSTNGSFSASPWRTDLGLVIGTNVQAYDADLTSYAGVTPSAYVLTFLNDADAATAQTTLGLAIGTNVQAYDADLTTYAGTTPTAFGLSVIDDVDAAAARTTLGSVIGTNVQAYDADLTSYAGVTPSAFILTLLNDADVSTAQATLDLDATYAAIAYVDATFAIPSGDYHNDGLIAQSAYSDSLGNAFLDFYIQFGQAVSTDAAGTAYTITDSYANVDLGTTDPVVVIDANTTDCFLYATIQTNFAGTTYVALQNVSVKLRRTNNTAADIGTARSQVVPIMTTTTLAGPSITIGPIAYSGTAGDSITLQAILSAAPGAGSVTITAASIAAVPR